MSRVLSVVTCRNYEKIHGREFLFTIARIS